jgi:glycerophosphoryl diester phosphodiesterase
VLNGVLVVICDDLGMTLVIAHRGASRAELENTVAAFRRAVEMGAEGIELDVRRTADDALVVHHNAVLADGRVICETVVSELPDHVPGLSVALDACDGVFVNLEIKNDPSEPDFDPTEWVARRTLLELVRRGTESRWLVSSFRPHTIDAVRRIAPSIRTALLVEGPPTGLLDRAAAGGHVAIHPDVRAVDQSVIRSAHRLGLAVNAWTCNDPDQIRQLIAWGIDGICTDVPDVALAVRSECDPSA